MTDYAEEPQRDAGDERQEFLERRLTGLGATDGPKVLGLSRWGTPLSVYHEKVNPAPPREASLPAWMGLAIQNVVAELYTAATGNRVRADNRHHRHPQHDWLVCHLDYRVWAQRDTLVECKTKAWMTGWGDEGTTKIPPDVWVQVQHEMLVTGATVVHVAVLFGHHTFRVYVIPRDEAFLAEYVPQMERFWVDHVLAKVPPVPLGHAVDSAIVRRENRGATKGSGLKAVTPEQAKVVEQLRLARMNAQQAATNEEALKNRVIEMIGNAEGITGAFGEITYRPTRDSTVTEWALVAGAYRKAIEDALAAHSIRGLRRLDLDALQSLYTRLEPGHPRLRIKFTQE